MSHPQTLCTGVVVSEHFPGQTLQNVSLHLKPRPKHNDQSQTLQAGGIIVAPRLLPHLARASLMPLLASSSPFHAFPKNAENARTIRSTSSRASGWRAKTANMRFLSCFTAQTGPQASKTRAGMPLFKPVPKGSLGPLLASHLASWPSWLP